MRAGALAVLEQAHAQVLLDGADELGRRVKRGPGVVQQNLHQLQRQRLAARLWLGLGLGLGFGLLVGWVGASLRRMNEETTSKKEAAASTASPDEWHGIRVLWLGLGLRLG